MLPKRSGLWFVVRVLLVVVVSGVLAVATTVVESIRVVCTGMVVRSRAVRDPPPAQILPAGWVLTRRMALGSGGRVGSFPPGLLVAGMYQDEWMGSSPPDPTAEVLVVSRAWTGRF